MYLGIVSTSEVKALVLDENNTVVASHSAADKSTAASAMV